MEIKEILENLKDEVWSKTGADSYDKLLDYITNLQQELEEYKDTETYSKRFLYKANKDRLNANLELVKENERLKIQVSAREELYEYSQSRIEKAVEYIEKNDYHYMNEYALKRFRNDLLNILNGRSDE